MSTQASRPNNLLEFLGRRNLDNSIEEREKIINLLNSLIDDKKDGKPPIMQNKVLLLCR